MKRVMPLCWRASDGGPILLGDLERYYDLNRFEWVR